MKFFSGFRFRAVLLAGLAVLPMLVFVVFLSHQQRADELQRMSQRAQALAGLVAGEQAQVLSQSRQLMTGLAMSSHSLTTGLLGPQCIRHLQQLLDAYDIYYQVVVADPQGNVRCAAQPLRKPVNIADRGYFQQAVATQKFSLSPVIVGRDSGRYMVAAAQALLDARGGVAGVLVAALDLRWVGEFLSHAELPKDTLVSIVDSSGTILARFPGTGSYAGKTIPDLEQFRRVVAGGHDGLFESQGLDSLERFIAYSRIPGLPGAPIYMRVGIPMWVVDEAGARRLRESVLVLAGLISLTLLIAYFGAERLVSGPLRQLTDAAGRLGKGDLAARTGVKHAASEVGQLAQKLDELAEHGERVSRAMLTLSAGNRTLLRETEEDALLQSMCRVAVEVGHYPLAFAAYARDDQAKTVQVIAHTGADDGLLGRLNMTWADNARGQGSVARAIRSGATAFVRDIASDPNAAPWRDEILPRGLRAVISLPLRVDGATIGTFTLFARELNAFDEQEVNLLEEMAADLSFGIATIRERARGTAAEARAEHAKTHDALTGLPNRTSFLRRLSGALVEAARDGETLAVLVVHLPRMQEVYDGLGHDPGNHILCEVAQRVRRVVAEENDLAQLPTDDVGVLLPRSGSGAAEALARRLNAALRSPVDVGQAQIEVQATIGISFFPEHGDAPDLLLRRAKLTARDAAQKELPYFVYAGVTERENPARLALAGELRGAIEQRHLLLHYQGKVELASGRACGAEALVRWQHPSKGMIPPMQFISIAEQTGLITPMTNFVIESVVRQLQSWAKDGHPVPTAVNLSARNLHDPGLVGRVEGLLSAWGLSPGLLEFEITESALVDDPGHAHKVLLALRDLGCKLYIDDFGTGYSSLSYLVSLPVHALKIDRSFVVQMSKNRQARSVVESVISMAHGLGLRVVAEGVETESDASILRDLGCDEAQGYFFSKPVAAEGFEARLGLRPT